MVDAIPDRLEDRHVPKYEGRISGGDVKLKLVAPQVETIQVDVGDGTMAKLDVEGGSSDSDCGLAGTLCVPCVNRRGEGVECVALRGTDGDSRRLKFG